jgi:hypothetical protein
MATTTRATMLALLASVAISVGAAAAPGPGRWYDLGWGLDFHVYALHAAGPNLYTGGAFTNAGGNASADRIARWNGTAWSPVGAGIANGSVRAIARLGSHVFAGGTFLNAGDDLDADFLARFDGTSWGSFCVESFNGNVLALQLAGDILYVGGAFQNAGGVPEADYLVGCDTETGAMFPVVDDSLDIGGPVYALTLANGMLYAGGNFTDVDDDTQADYVARYDGSSWHALGAGSTGIVRALGTDGTNIYIGTDGENVGGDARADHVAKWDGTTWSPLGADTAGTGGWFTTTTTIYGLTTVSGLVIATGQFQDANGQATADNIAYFDGTTWRPMGSNGAGNGPWSGSGQALAVFQGHAYAAGIFTSAGGSSGTTFITRFALRLPDARIGTVASGPFSGDDVYSATGSGQSQSLSIRRGNDKSVYVSIQNDGILPASFKVRGTGGSSGHTIKYFSGATNVTAAVKNGTYATASIAPGATVTLRMRITLSASAAASGTFRTTVMSTVGTPNDAVRTVVSATN